MILLPFIHRDVTEPLEKTLIRIGRKHKKGSSPVKKVTQDSTDPGAVLLSRADGGLAYDLSELTNGQWESGMCVYINEHLSLTGKLAFRT